jgi:long-chain acyl-CoA synthetase
VDVRVGDEDELLVKSPGVMLGYWNDPERTAAAIDRDGWLHTGDQAKILRQHIYITGRIKDIIVLANGEKVSPERLEMAIVMDPLFDQIMVMGEGRTHLGAIAVLNSKRWMEFTNELGVAGSDPASLERKDVHAAVLKTIEQQLRAFPPYAQVRELILSLEPWTVENGLLTPTLKPIRHRVLAHFGQ